MSEQSKHTALYTQHQAHGASFTDFGGWQMPLKYRSELEEHHTVRKAAGLFDLSHMGEVLVSGPQAAQFLNYALVSNLAVLAVGKAKYSLICTAEGGVIDDLITYRLAEDSFLVVPNASNAPVVAEELRLRAKGFDVAVEDQSSLISICAVCGACRSGLSSSCHSPDPTRSISPRMAIIASMKRSSSARSSDSVGSTMSVPATGKLSVGAWKP